MACSQEPVRQKHGQPLKLGSKQAPKGDWYIYAVNLSLPYTHVYASGPAASMSSAPAAASTTSRGWDFDSDWGSFDEPSSSAQPTPSSESADKLSRQEQLQKKREERRQRQQEARVKRAAGGQLRPSGLGAVKKE